MSSSNVVEIVARQCLHSPVSYTTQLSQTKHRFDIVATWNIPVRARILELGCGQGDCTAVLAETVGLEEHVTAVDPGPLDYGSPFTLEQAQSQLSSSVLGSRITFKQADPLNFLARISADAFNVTVLAHCTWYFSSPTIFAATLMALSTKVKRIVVAEWCLKATSSSAIPHVYAVLAQAALECHKPQSTSNVRTVLSPIRIREAAALAGLCLDSQTIVHPEPGLSDGRWEVEAVLARQFREEVDTFVTDEREHSMLLAMLDAVQLSVENGWKMDWRMLPAWTFGVARFLQP